MAARRMAIIGLLLCLCLAWLPRSAQGASTADACEPIATDRTCTLTLTYSCSGVSFSGLPVKLYQIAEASAEARYTLTGRFRDSALELNGIRTNGEWEMIRTTLEAHILANSIAPDAVAETDLNGEISFDTLKPGLYLVESVYGEQDGLQCSFRSSLIALPGLDTEGLWQYDLTVSLKPEILPPVEPDELSYQILKLWKDNGSQEKRPVSIRVEIFRDGVSCGIVILSEENNWTYRWSAPADGSRWMVVEREIPDGYSVTVEERSTTFLITNTISKDPPGNPQTGDSANIQLVLVLLLLSGAGLIGLGTIRRRVSG